MLLNQWVIIVYRLSEWTKDTLKQPIEYYKIWSIFEYKKKQTKVRLSFKKSLRKAYVKNVSILEFEQNV